MVDMSSVTSMYSDVYANASRQSAEKLQNQLKSDYSQATEDELMDVCKQFEAYFLEQMFKEMVKTIPTSEESSGSTSSMMDYYKDMMIQNVASTATEQSGLGLAQMLYEQMRRNYGMDGVDMAAGAATADGADAADNAVALD